MCPHLLHGFIWPILLGKADKRGGDDGGVQQVIMSHGKALSDLNSCCVAKFLSIECIINPIKNRAALARDKPT